jgi:hypothetical protein
VRLLGISKRGDKYLRTLLIQSESALQHAFVGIVLVILLAGCVAKVRAPGPGPVYYGAVIDIAHSRGTVATG